MLSSLILWPVEQLLNQLIQRDDYLRRQFAAFAGKTFAVSSTSPTQNLILQIDTQGLQLSAHSATALGVIPDASISGKFVDLLGLLTSETSERALVNDKIRIDGDASLVQDFYLTCKQLDVDWQDYLAPLIGDHLTHELGKFQQRSESMITDSAQRLRRSIEYYLKDEREIVPHQDDVALFMGELDSLKLQIDRTGARLAAFEARIDELSD